MDSDQILVHHETPSGKLLIGYGFIFLLRDNDPKHIAGGVKSSLDRKTSKQVPSVTDWPPQYQHLSIIEGVQNRTTGSHHLTESSERPLRSLENYSRRLLTEMIRKLI